MDLESRPAERVELEQGLALVRDAYANCMPHMRYPFAKLRDFVKERSSEGSLLDITVNHVNLGQAQAGSGNSSGTRPLVTIEDFQAGPPINLSLDALTGMKLRVMFIENDTGLVCRASCAESVVDTVAVGHFCQDMRNTLERAASLTSSNL